MSNSSILRSHEFVNFIESAAEMQIAFQKAVDEKKLTKKVLCDLCIPFKEKYHLDDIAVLRIAQQKETLVFLIDVFNQYWSSK